MLVGASAFLVSLASAAAAQQQQQQVPIKGDFLARQEWTENIFSKPDPVPGQRRRFQLRPRMELESGSLRILVGADLNYSSDKNVAPKDEAVPLRLIRDNYDSRGIRLDLLALGVTLGGNLKVDVGRMPMNLRTTEMIWDRDLRAQGVAVAWGLVSQGSGQEVVRLAGVYSRGGHVFRDTRAATGSSTGEGVTLKGGSLDIGIGTKIRGEVTASYLRFDKTEFLEPMIRRQNTRRTGGVLGAEFGVVDLVGRFRWDARVPVQAVFNYAINHKATSQKNGLWATAVLGSLKDSRARVEYTFARVDRDVTVAAYAGDDFFWGTGWLGHRVDLGIAQTPQTSYHVVGQLQRFKDGPLAERQNTVQRLRVEARRTF